MPQDNLLTHTINRYREMSCTTHHCVAHPHRFAVLDDRTGRIVKRVICREALTVDTVPEVVSEFATWREDGMPVVVLWADCLSEKVVEALSLAGVMVEAVERGAACD